MPARPEEKRSNILRRLEIPVNESLWLHAMEVGHTLGTLETPAHGMGSCVRGQRFSSVQHWGQNKHSHNKPHTLEKYILGVNQRQTDS